ncbi:MAG: OsmC family protein [Myxococcota bacterium]|jgi:putative redox protein|nr:OsmC family protein [Myxococcota bacterium]
MQTSLTWKGEGLRFEARNEQGASCTFDGKGEQGPSPMEAVALALASCSAIDVLMILQKMRQDVRACRCHVQAQRRDEIPKTFTQLHLHYELEGQLDPRKVEQALVMSHEKYCSVGAMLKAAGVTIEYDFELLPAL